MQSSFRREAAPDPLGLQATADRLAEQLLPGLAQYTNRARYYSFFCWTRKHAAARHTGHAQIEHEMRAWEVALTFCAFGSAEAECQGHTCHYVGSARLKRRFGGKRPTEVEAGRRRLIAHASELFRSPLWHFYRHSMWSLGLLEPDRWTLTPDGERLASRWARRAQPAEDGKVIPPEVAYAGLG